MQCRRMSIKSSFLNSTHLATVSVKEGEVPKWIQIFPAGPDLETLDGRSFKMSDAAAFVHKLNVAAKPLLIDYDHRSHFSAGDGGSTEAAGWMTSFEVREGSIWAFVEWSEKAAAAIAAKTFRSISPEFQTNKKTGEITALLAAALLNRPAFEMTALASEQKTKEPKMLKAIAKALGLDESADEKSILTAIEKSNADHETQLASEKAKAKTPSVEDFMPRADYDTVLARATTAEEQVAKAGKEAFDQKVETMIAAAIKDGKITPASRSHYVDLCADEKLFETTCKLLEITPEVIGKTEIVGKPDDGPGDDSQKIANLARVHQKEQREMGIEISTADAVTAVTK